MEWNKSIKGRSIELAEVAGAIVVKVVIIALLLALTVVQASAYVDLIMPTDGASLSNSTVEFDYYPALENGTDECALEVNGNVILVDDNVSNSAINTIRTSSMPEGAYVWSMICSNVDTSEASNSRSFSLDTTMPTVNLINPADGSVATNRLDVTFSTTDNQASVMKCEVLVDGAVRKSNVSADNNTQVSATINNIEAGSHTWRVACTDDAGNTGASTQRSFESQVSADFSLSLDKSEYDLGDQIVLTADAPDGTNLSLEICPDGQGFVECFASITLEDKTYPRTEYLPYSNKTGTYILDAFFSYNSEQESQQLTYTVLNNMDVAINGDTEVRTTRETTLKADALGGQGALSYEWTLHNGTKKQGKQLTLKFNTPGDFNEKVTVTDEAGNQASKTISVKVYKAYEITVIVKDSKTNKAVEDIAVEIDNEQDITGPEGTAVFWTRAGKRDLYAYSDSYEFYESKVDVNEKKTVTIKVVQKQNVSLKASLTGPANDASVAPGSRELKYKVENANSADCTIYVNGGDGFESVGSQEVTDGSEKKFAHDFEEGSYDWKVICEQGSTSYETAPRSLNVEEQEATVQTTSSEQVPEFDKSGLEDDLSKVLDTYARMSSRERNIAEKLGYYKDAKDALKKVQRAARDIHDLAFRTSLTDAEKEQRRENIIKETLADYKEVVRDLKVTQSKNFVNYPTLEELMPVVEVYAEQENYDGKLDGVAEAINSLQGIMVVSTNTMNLELERVDGSKEMVTAVVKEVKTEDVPEGAYLYEYVPKEVAQSVDDIYLLGKYEIVKEDPVLRFEVVDEIAYYFDGEIPLEQLKGTRTVLLRDHLAAELKAVTGSASLFVPDIDPGSKGFLITVLILLLAIYLVYDTELWKKAWGMLNKKQTDKETHYIRVLVNDALDNLEADNYDKASLIYREIKLTFENMSVHAKQEVFEEVMNLVNRMDIAYSRELSSNIDKALKEGNYDKARKLYSKLQATYRKLGEDYKKEIYDKVMSISGKLQ